MSDKYPYLTEDDEFDCENGSSVDLMVLVNDIRRELAAQLAEIERMRGIIRGTEWVLSADEYDPSKETIVVQYECAICHFVYLDRPGEHAEYCPFYQWEAAK